MSVRLDPNLFEPNQWIDATSPLTLSMFQTFSALFFQNLRHHPQKVRQDELDNFIALLRDPTLLQQAFFQIEWLRQDL